MVNREFSARGGIAYVDPDLRSWGQPFKTHKTATWPFARLRVGMSLITISSLFGEFQVTRSNLVSISRFGRIPVLADGFMFVVDGDDAVIFWAILRVGKIRDELRLRDWAVGDTR